MHESISHFTMGLNGSLYEYVALILTWVQILNFVNKLFVISSLFMKFMKILCNENLENTVYITSENIPKFRITLESPRTPLYPLFHPVELQLISLMFYNPWEKAL